MQSEPQGASSLVWALPRSLAATYGITFDFSSSGYLDVSVHRVPCLKLCIYLRLTGVFPAGFPHSDICGSMCICHSPQLFAAYHVFHRLLVPRHPPCALYSLTITDSHQHKQYRNCPLSFDNFLFSSLIHIALCIKDVCFVVSGSSMSIIIVVSD